MPPIFWIGVNRRDIHGDLQRDLVEPVHAGCNVDIHADINVVELSIDQRIDADTADARLERAGGHRHALANLQRSLLTVGSTDLRLLDKLATAVAQQKIRGRSGNRYLEIRGV